MRKAIRVYPYFVLSGEIPLKPVQEKLVFNHVTLIKIKGQIQNYQKIETIMPIDDKHKCNFHEAGFSSTII